MVHLLHGKVTFHLKDLAFETVLVLPVLVGWLITSEIEIILVNTQALQVFQHYHIYHDRSRVCEEANGAQTQHHLTFF